jgi:hypothetical protein
MPLSLLLINAACTLFMNVCIQLALSLPKMQDQQSLTCCWLEFSGWGRECVLLVFDYKGGQYIRKRQWCTTGNILRLAVGYLNATMNRKPQTLQLGIGADGARQKRQSLRVDRYGSSSGPTRCCWLGFWTGYKPNWKMLAIPIRTAAVLPEPVANSNLKWQRW